MRIAYLSQMADVSHENGIAKKIRSQINTWVSTRHAVRYFALAPTAEVWPGFASIDSTIIVRGKSLDRLFRAPHLGEAVRQWKPDVIYFRYGHHVTGLRSLFRAIPTIGEINSDDLKEYPLKFPLSKQVYHRLTRNWVLTAISGFVTVTEELADRFRSFHRPILPLGNSITLSEYPIAPLPGPQEKGHVIFLGSPAAPWHGLDRIASLAALMPDWTFDMVGSNRDEAQQTLKQTPIPSNLLFHGHLGREGYEPFFARATAALGSFALWRNQMNEASPLKVREYLARGLPVIATYKDTDIADGSEHFLRLPNNDASLQPELPRVRSFLERWRRRRVERNAISSLDTSVKESQRLEFIAKTASDFHHR